MVSGLVEGSSEFTMIYSGYSLSFSGSDWKERVSVQAIANKSVNIFRIVSFIEGVDLGFSRSVTLNKEFFCVRDIMDRLPGYLEPVMIC
jgi:hypothetical protein